MSDKKTEIPDLSQLKPGGDTEGKIVVGRRRRRLVENDVKRMRLGRAYWSTDLRGVQYEPVRTVIDRFLKNIRGNIGSGNGLVIAGDEGVGKSGAAMLIAMEAVRWGYSALIVSHEDMQELRFEDRQYDDSLSMMERVRTVELLVLDNFNEDFIDDGKFGPLMLEKLLQRRNANRLSTILTTRISADRLREDKKLKGLGGVLRESTVLLVIEGQDLRQARHEKIRQMIVDDKEKKDV